MKEKKSFLIYCDWESLLTPMTKEQIGELFLAIFDYNKNGVVPEFEDKLLAGVFSFMQSRFDDDNKKYERICKQNAEYAKKRWEKEKQKSENQIQENGASENRINNSNMQKKSVGEPEYIANVTPGFPPVKRLID